MLKNDNLNEYDLESVLGWYVENGIDSAWLDAPQNRLLPIAKPAVTLDTSRPEIKEIIKPSIQTADPVIAGQPMKDAMIAAKSIQDLSGLKQALFDFPHLTIKNTATQIVCGEGRVPSDLMVIGDAPNSDDDRSGIVFSGELGELLNKMMGAIGRTRAGDTAETSFYVTNVLKWRPPGNRSPTPFELDLALPFLKAEIDIVQPKAIFVLGAVATKLLLGSTETITKLRGKFREYETEQGRKISVMPSFHPSYLLKSPTQKKQSWEDLQALRDVLATPLSS